MWVTRCTVSDGTHEVYVTTRFYRYHDGSLSNDRLTYLYVNCLFLSVCYIILMLSPWTGPVLSKGFLHWQPNFRFSTSFLLYVKVCLPSVEITLFFEFPKLFDFLSIGLIFKLSLSFLNFTSVPGFLYVPKTNTQYHLSNLVVIPLENSL